jgi:hypothetical protein
MMAVIAAAVAVTLSPTMQYGFDWAGKKKAVPEHEKRRRLFLSISLSLSLSVSLSSTLKV